MQVLQTTPETMTSDLMDRARSILKKTRASAAQTRKVDGETRLCAIIASLPKGVKVQDVAPTYGLTPTTLSRLRGMAFRGTMAFPDALRPALVRSYIPRNPT